MQGIINGGRNLIAKSCVLITPVDLQDLFPIFDILMGGRSVVLSSEYNDWGADRTCRRWAISGFFLVGIHRQAKIGLAALVRLAFGDSVDGASEELAMGFTLSALDVRWRSDRPAGVEHRWGSDFARKQNVGGIMAIRMHSPLGCHFGDADLSRPVDTARTCWGEPDSHEAGDARGGGVAAGLWCKVKGSIS